ncbi:MAG: 3-deoxy-D-manno-octulosonic acid transferase, partial [Oceanococcaceae bacterium]
MYPILARLLFPLVLLGMRWRARREPLWGRDLASRRGLFGALYKVPADPPLWIHAASVGEVNSAQGLLQAVRARWPQQPLLLTAFTPSGCEAWQRLARDDPGIAVRPLPLDHPRWMARAFRSVRPCGLVLIETEIWPHMLGCAHQRACPVVMISARVGERSVRGWERWLGRALLADILTPIAHVGAQTEADAERLHRLGARHVVVEGSLKWDRLAPDATDATVAMLRNALGERPNWLAASTHPGEEAMVLRAHQHLRADDPQWLLILAPRHPRRADEVAALCATMGMRCVRRSRGEPIADAAVWLIDTLGELVHLMAAADRVFMGGSLVPIGGHNLLEP